MRQGLSSNVQTVQARLLLSSAPRLDVFRPEVKGVSDPAFSVRSDAEAETVANRFPLPAPLSRRLV